MTERRQAGSERRLDHPINEGDTRQRFERLETGHAGLLKGQEDLQRTLDANSRMTKETSDSVADLVKWLRGFQFLWALINFMARVATVVGVVGGAVAVFVIYFRGGRL